MSNEKPTTELLDILNKLPTDQMDSYIQEYDVTSCRNSIFSEYLHECQMPVSAVVKNCAGLISKSYIYDILNGVKTNPARDIVLVLCIAAHMDRKMTRRVLERYGHRDLYAKDTRDIIIAIYINNKQFDLNQINDELYHYGVPHIPS